MRRIAVATLLILFSLHTWADFQDGQDAYNRRDYETALSEWLPLAEQGSAEAQFLVSEFYEMGLGVAADQIEARRWLLLAAEQGHPMAQFYIGIGYDHGLGVPKDDAEAVNWYRLAAEQGLAEAQFNLGNSYQWGVGVVQDFAVAHMWFNLAAAQGDGLAGDLRDRIAAEMPPSQIEEAHNLVVRI